MPNKIIKYTCGFKCGTHAKQMLKHETSCYKNPENKTCAICTNQIYERDSDDYITWHIRDCKIKRMSELLEEIGDNLIIDSGVHHVKPLYHCPNHNQPTEIKGTEEYCEMLRGKYNEEADPTLDHYFNF